MKILKNTLWTAAGVLALTAFAFAPAATADQQILDDLIVDGSACVGQDCVNGESFGFDTIRIKENNLRIRAVDTSSTASFPTFDWQLTFNDSSNGGANKFAVECIDGGTTPFTIEGCAPSHSLYVKSNGHVGFGTSTPVVDLHVKSGNTPTLRLEQDGSSGFSAQIWDLAGNEANLFFRDASNGSTLPFRIFPGAPSNALTIEASGDIGVGTTSPDASLNVRRSDGTAQIHVDEQSGTLANSRIQLKLTNNGAAQAAFVNTDTGDDWRMQNQAGSFRISKAGTGSAEMDLDGSGNVVFRGTVAANNGADTLPDYVFEPDYELLPLHELKSFVESNKHLPNVPSQADVNASGGTINMTEMQYRLLEKIEELTLYTLQQQEQIDELTAQLAAGE